MGNTQDSMMSVGLGRRTQRQQNMPIRNLDLFDRINLLTTRLDENQISQVATAYFSVTGLSLPVKKKKYIK